jgi:acyl dehydratase
MTVFSTPKEDRYFEDYTAGAAYEYGPIEVEEGEVIGFASRFDPQTIHVDPAVAARGPFHGLIASGWHTASLMMRLFVDHYLSSGASLSSPGVDELRWLKPVRPGDQLTLRVRTTATRPSKTKPDRGLVHSTLEGINQNGDLVVSFKAVNILGRRPE